jgi:hypothetical protein
MHPLWRKIGIGAAIVIVVIVGVAWALRWWGVIERRPAMTAVPPLAPVTRSSTVIAPVQISLNAIRDALERASPPQLSATPDIPPLPFVGTLDLAWSVARGPLSVTGRPEGLTISTALSGSMRAAGQSAGSGGGLPGSAGELSDFIGSLLGGGAAPPRRQNPAQQNQPERKLEQSASIRGSVTLAARPVLLPQWRLEPNLTSQVTISDASLSIFGMNLSVPDEVKPLLERSIDEQVSSLEQWLRQDSFLEMAARQEWTKMCRSVPLGAAAPDMPDLWLEVRPTRAFAADPHIDQGSVTLTVGVQSDTRIVPNETKPDCPFPEQLEIVQQAEKGRVHIGVPIDIPFTELNRLIEAQLKGKTFPDDQSSAFTATIKSVKMAASGDRLLISVGIRANETKTWFGFGADAVIHVWGRPVLDPSRQILRLDDIALDVESAAAFGVLGAAARTALPYLERALAENAVIDLVPLANNARKSIEAAVADFRKRTDSIRVDAEVLDLRLVGVEFDEKTLRVIGEANGTVRVVVTRLDDL